jgi:hypothetical protein
VRYGFDVLAIDGQASQLEGSEKLAAGLADKDSSSSGRIQYMVKMVESGNLPDVRNWMQEQYGEGEGKGMVVALHACGSLTDDALRVFLENDGVAACAVIGCVSSLLVFFPKG